MKGSQIMTYKSDVIDKHIDHIIDFRRTLHKNPELSFKEFETTKRILEGLEDTKIKFYDLSRETGLIGMLEKDPSYDYIAVRGDIDALPIEEQTDLDFKSQNEGIMHACGHDIHASIIYGFAKIIDELYDHLKYNIVFIFQPAEEVMGGAKFIREELERLEIPVDKVMMYHTWPTLNEGLIGYRKEDMMAGSTSFNAEIRVKGGHAAHPSKTPDPIYLASNVIQFIQSIVSRFNNPTTPLVVTVGKIHAGDRNNVIPSKLEFGGTIRSFSVESIDLAKKMIEEYLMSVTELAGAEAEINFRGYCPPVVNNPELVSEFINAGGEGDSKFHELKEPSMGSEDFAFLMEKYVGAAFRIGTRIEGVEESGLSLHSPEIIFSEKSLRTGIEALVDFATQDD